MHFQVISGDLKDVCMPNACTYCQGQPPSPAPVASAQPENSPWNPKDKQGLFPGPVVSLKLCWLLPSLLQLLPDGIWGKLALGGISDTLQATCIQQIGLEHLLWARCCSEC